MMKIIGLVVAVLTLCSASPAVLADEVKIAAAANFIEAMKEIATAFERKTAHTTTISFGATGQLYAQIVNGAPFEVFLSADQTTPQRLVDEGQASRPFTYAVGKLVLWSADPNLVDRDGKVLEGAAFDKIAIANPKTAPYGAAADQVMKARGVYDKLKPKRVEGQNIAQTYQFVVTRNAQLGFVALSQTIMDKSGSSWEIPQDLYDPIRQDAVLLKRGEANPAAAALIEYLRGDEARAVIARYGYSVE